MALTRTRLYSAVVVVGITLGVLTHYTPVEAQPQTCSTIGYTCAQFCGAPWDYDMEMEFELFQCTYEDGTKGPIHLAETWYCCWFGGW